MTDLSDLTFRIQERKRPDRHPYQLGVLIGLIGFSTSQIIVGVPPTSLLYATVRHSLLISLHLTLIMGSVLTLMGAALHRDRDPRLSLRLGIAGQFSIFIGVISYVFIVTSNTDAPYWLSVLSVAITVGIAYASLHRMLQQWRALRDLKKVVDLIKPRHPHVR